MTENNPEQPTTLDDSFASPTGEHLPAKWVLVKKDGSFRELSPSEVPESARREANKPLLERLRGITPSVDIDPIDPSTDPNVYGKPGSWNYRWMRSETSLGDIYAIHEVYYDTNGAVTNWTVKPVEVVADNHEDMDEVLGKVGRAVLLPVLDVKTGKEITGLVGGAKQPSTTEPDDASGMN